MKIYTDLKGKKQKELIYTILFLEKLLECEMASLKLHK